MYPDALTRQKLTEQVLRQLQDRPAADDEFLRRLILLAVADEYSGTGLSITQKKLISEHIFNSMRGFDILQPLMADPAITEIMVNAPDRIFYEKEGCLYKSGLCFDDSAHLMQMITHLFGRANKQINEKKPLADMRLSDGSRIHAVLPPASPEGPVVTIRKFTGLTMNIEALVDSNFISHQAADFLLQAVKQKKTVFICGGTGVGKTTFLNIIGLYIPPEERIVIIEDTAELSFTHSQNCVRLETRAAAPDGSGEIGIDQLIRESLRMRPDRLIIGEVRGAEAFAMLQAMNTGHPGSLCTGHGNSCADMLKRLSLMVLMAVNLPLDAINGLISSAIDYVVHLQRTADGRREINEIAQVVNNTRSVILKEVFVRQEGELRYVTCK